MASHILRRGRGVRHSAPAEFSERRDVEVLRQSTTNRKLVAARLGRSRSTVDKILEDEERSPVTTLRLWLEANLESGADDALAPLVYLRDRFVDHLAGDGAHRGDREDLLRETADAMASFAALSHELSVAMRDGRVSDSERAAIEKLIRRHENELAELRREAAASNDRFNARRAG